MYFPTSDCVRAYVEEVAPEISDQLDAVPGVAVRCHWYVIVTPVSPSGSLTVAVSVWSSAVVPLSETDPILFTFATVTVKDWVTAVVPSVAERTTAFDPTSSLSGVPVNAPLA